MPRGIPWDSLPSPYERKHNEQPSLNQIQPIEGSQEPALPAFDFEKHPMEIVRRVAFGVICGSLTGASFGFVEVLRSPELMTGKAKTATNKVVSYAGKFAGFFGAYHGMRKVLGVFTPLTAEYNVGAAAAICLTPLAISPLLRPMIPYGIVMIGLDAINGLNDI